MNALGRRALLTVGIFGLLLAAWEWSLLTSLLRPTLVAQGLMAAPTDVPAPGFLYPRLGIRAPVTEAPFTSPLEYHDWRELRAALRSGVSLAYRGSNFENAPLVFVTGHSSDTIQQPYAAIFAGLGQATVGDQFQLNLADHQSFYTVTDRHEFDPRNTAAFEALASNMGQRVALVTCWPPLTTRYRLVIVGQRVNQP